VHGILADENFDPRAIMEDKYVKFEKSMESIGTVADWDRQYSNSGATVHLAAD
jgi:hypothetical protein